MRLYQLFLASLAFALRTNASGGSDDDHELRQLTDDNFKASIGHGLWYVILFALSIRTEQFKGDRRANVQAGRALFTEM